MLREAPGCYILVGNGAGCDCGSLALHKPTYDFNDNILSAGLRYWQVLVEQRLAK